MANISIFGTGYVGLIAGVCFAKYGHKVICVDIDESKIERLKQGDPVIYEPGIKEILDEVIEKNNIEFTTNQEYAIKNSDIHFICVGTPTLEGSLEHNLTYVFNVANNIGRYMDHYSIIVDKSTVPPGTSKQVKKIVQEQLNLRGINLEFDVVSNPEFLREGSSINDFLYGDRIVVGSESDKALNLMKEIYQSIIDNGSKWIPMKCIESAEMTKDVANALLATKIAFVNETANVCEKIGADYSEVELGIGTDSRIGSKFLKPGPGYGGSCFPKDTRGLAHLAKSVGAPMKIVEKVIEVNELQKKLCAQSIEDYYSQNLNGIIFGVWGTAFKANTDDMRESSSITIVNYLVSKGAKIKVHDFEALKNAKKIFSKHGENVIYCNSKEEVLENVNSLIVLTEWEQYKQIEFDQLINLFNKLSDKTVFDFRNLYADYKNWFNDHNIKWVGRGILQ